MRVERTESLPSACRPHFDPPRMRGEGTHGRFRYCSIPPPAATVEAHERLIGSEIAVRRNRVHAFARLCVVAEESEASPRPRAIRAASRKLSRDEPPSAAIRNDRLLHSEIRSGQGASHQGGRDPVVAGFCSNLSSIAEQSRAQPHREGVAAEKFQLAQQTVFRWSIDTQRQRQASSLVAQTW